MTLLYTYENGEPFTDTLRENMDALIDRVHRKGMAAVIVVSGTPGTGKTTLATHLGAYVAKKLGRPGFDFEKQIDIGGERFLEKARYCVDHNLPVLVFDEAFAFSRRKSLTKFNQDLNEFFQEFRTFKLIVILCLPDYNHLDRWLYHVRVVRLLIECTKKHLPSNRGVGYVGFKGYGIKRIFDVLNIRDKTRLPYASSKVTPNFQGYFKPHPPDTQARLDAASTAGKKKRIDRKTQKGLVSVNDIVAATGLEHKHIWYLIKDRGHTAADKQGNMYLYDKSIIEKIKAERLYKKKGGGKDANSPRPV